MKTFREHIHRVCTNTDLKDQEEATMLVQYLAHELIRYHELNLMYEHKIKELMSAKDFEKWVREAAKQLFRTEVDGMEDGDFKDFVQKNFDKIVGDKS